MNKDLFVVQRLICRGPGSSVGIAAGYGMDGTGIDPRWEARFSAPVQTVLRAHPAFCTMGTGSFLRVKSGRGVTLTLHSLLVPWSRKSRAIPLLHLWAVRPVQSFSACTVQLYLYSPYGPYGLYKASVHVQCCTLQFLSFTNSNLEVEGTKVCTCNKICCVPSANPYPANVENMASS